MRSSRAQDKHKYCDSFVIVFQERPEVHCGKVGMQFVSVRCVKSDSKCRYGFQHMCRNWGSWQMLKACTMYTLSTPLVPGSDQCCFFVLKSQIIWAKSQIRKHEIHIVFSLFPLLSHPGRSSHFQRKHGRGSEGMWLLQSLKSISFLRSENLYVFLIAISWEYKQPDVLLLFNQYLLNKWINESSFDMLFCLCWYCSREFSHPHPYGSAFWWAAWGTETLGFQQWCVDTCSLKTNAKIKAKMKTIYARRFSFSHRSFFLLIHY